jgi:two-component system cell cycle response regulator DivK
LIALIIDDNTLNQETLALLLKKEGLESVCVTFPRDIFPTLDSLEEDIEVVFLDLEFPNFNAMTMVDDLKSHPALQSVPIVAYSVHISEIRETRDAGFDSFLGKPLNTAAFPEQLRRIRQGEPVWDVGQ